MPTEDLDDDYVANLLKNDAKTSSKKYTMVGLEAFLPKRPTVKAPKPNTRFLRNILRETDNHNAALLAKEAEESRARLRALHRERDGRLTPYQSDGHTSSRSRRDDARPSKRRRLEDGTEEKADEKRKRSTGERSRSHRHQRDRGSTREKRRKREEYSGDEDDYRSRHSHHHHRSRKYRHRSESEVRSRRYKDTHQSHKRRRSYSRSLSRSSSPEDRRRHHKSRRKREETGPPSSSPEPARSRASLSKPSSHTSLKLKRSSNKPRSPSADSSDPLEAIVGPALPPLEPEVRSRGRGAFTSSSAMDAHFSASYDPSNDAQPRSDLEDDWDQALEALRDRQRWKQQGADRLRAAGFTDEEVKKWEKGGEKTEEDVRWAKKGEGREWDRGKVVDEDGQVDVRAEWGRLKGT